MEVVVSNPQKLEELKAKIKDQGKDKLHVLADFDRTLTEGFIEGQKAPSVIAQLREGDYLSPDYVKRAHELFDIYHPIEIDFSISDKEKDYKMNEWWTKHFELMVECGLNKEVIKQVVEKGNLKFRNGTLEFIDFLHENDIPLIIMSASVGDILIEYLKKESRLYNNVHVISNSFIYDEKGNVTGVKDPIIHSFNKNEVSLKCLSIYEDLLKRKNVLLLGDSLGDAEMIEGFDYDNLIKIGFLNEKVEERLEKFKELYNVVLLGDPGMDYINEFLGDIV